jgi:Tfp pilus assembly protein PilX
MKKHLQNGFAHMVVLLALLILVVIGLAGYKVAMNHSASVSSTSAATAAQQVKAIKNTADLNNAESTLNNVNVDGDLNPDSLNDDVSSLL